MESFLNPTAGESDIGSNECIEQYFPLVYICARRAFPLNIGPFDSDDLAQEACVKLWLIGRKQVIQSPKTYIRRVVQSVKVDMLRKYKTQTYQALPVDEDGELQEGHLIVTQSPELGDPEIILEQDEGFDELLNELLDAMAALHLRQKQASVCTLRERVDDLLGFVDALQAKGIESEWQWPEDKVDHQRLQASYAHARRNIASHMHVEGANGPRSHETPHRY